MIKAVIFDLDDTLYPEIGYVRSCMRAVADFAASGDADKAEEYRKIAAAVCEDSAFGVIDRFADEIGADAERIPEFVEAYRSCEPKIELYPDVLPCLDELKNRDVRLALLTDGRPDGQRKKISALGIADKFDKIIITDELGKDCRKPNERAYEMICEEFGVKPDETAVVGDNPSKDFAIGDNGFRTVRVMRDGLYKDAEYHKGITEQHRVESLSELGELFEQSVPIRVLQMTGNLGWGGVSAAVMNYYRFIDRSKVQFDFVVGGDYKKRHDEEVERLGGKIYRLPSRNKHPFKYKKALKKLLVSHPEYKIFHANGNSASICLDLGVAKKCNVPTRIGHSHNTSCFLKLQHYIFRPFINGKVTHRFACSTEAGKWLFGKAPVTLVNNAVDLEKFAFNEANRAKIRAELGVMDSEPLFGCVGRLSENKNHKFAVSVFSEYRKQFGKGKLVIIGEGSLRGELQKSIDEMGLTEAVTLYGRANNVDEFYSAFDVFLLPSLYEGLAIVAIEAQASGLPIIVSDRVTGEIAITDNVTTLPIDDPKKWADVMNTAAIAKRPSVSREQIAESGYDIVTEAKKLQEFYLKCPN